MQASLVNHLVADGQRGIKVDPNKFKEVFRSKYAKARVFKIIDVDEESKAWVADPKSKICDAQGSWFCRGQYPPALQEVLKKGKNFVQLEDFNKKDEDSDFQKLYHEGLATQREKHAQKAKKQQSSQGDL
jgi:dolichyl-diphosphooligosaccharide--protein glycosyltransferase